MDALALCETKIDDSINDSCLSVNGYDLFRSDRSCHGGGVALYVASQYCGSVLSFTADLEGVAVIPRTPARALVGGALKRDRLKSQSVCLSVCLSVCR